MAEEQGGHRRKIEDKMSSATVEQMRLQFKENRVGQACAVSIALAFLAAGVYVAINGHPWPGAILGGLGGGGVGLQTIISAFLRRVGPPEEDKLLPNPPVVKPVPKKRKK